MKDKKISGRGRFRKIRVMVLAIECVSAITDFEGLREVGNRSFLLASNDTHNTPYRVPEGEHGRLH